MSDKSELRGTQQAQSTHEDLLELHDLLHRESESETIRLVRERLAEPGEPLDFDTFVTEVLGMAIGEDGIVRAGKVPTHDSKELE